MLRDERKKPPAQSGTEKTVKQLLGELYGDKAFLEKLLKDTGSCDFGKHTSNKMPHTGQNIFKKRHFVVIMKVYYFDVSDTSSKNGQQIYDLACDGLHYLDTRTDFWRQQKPMYSRKREKQERLKGKQKHGNHETYVMNQLERIDQGK